MLDEQRTREIMALFYYECYKFWEREGKDIDEAKQLAMRDCMNINYDPYEPCGERLDETAKTECLEKLKILERIV